MNYGPEVFSNTVYDGYFRCGFIFGEFRESVLSKISNFYIWLFTSNENITKIAKLSHHEFPHLV